MVAWPDVISRRRRWLRCRRVGADVQDRNDVSEPTTAGNDTFVVDGTDCPTYAVPVIEELSTSIHELSVADDNHSETQSTSSSSPLPPRSQTDSQVRVIQTQKGHPKLCFQGYNYHLHLKRPRDGLRWRCKERLINCTGAVVTYVAMKHA